MIAVRVKAKIARGRWRAKRFWPEQAVEAEVSEAELAALEADPVLKVERISALSGARKVDDAQPSPADDAPPPIVMFPKGSKSREIQEKLLDQDAKEGARRQRERKEIDPPPVENDEDIEPGNMVGSPSAEAPPSAAADYAKSKHQQQQPKKK